MATQPKSSEAADAALSAIEEALNLGPADHVAATPAGTADKPLNFPKSPPMNSAPRLAIARPATPLRR